MRIDFLPDGRLLVESALAPQIGPFGVLPQAGHGG
jgi:hypothetical protein